METPNETKSEKEDLTENQKPLTDHTSNRESSEDAEEIVEDKVEEVVENTQDEVASELVNTHKKDDATLNNDHAPLVNTENTDSSISSNQNKQESDSDSLSDSERNQLIDEIHDSIAKNQSLRKNWEDYKPGEAPAMVSDDTQDNENQSNSDSAYPLKEIVDSSDGEDNDLIHTYLNRVKENKTKPDKGKKQQEQMELINRFIQSGMQFKNKENVNPAELVSPDQQDLSQPSTHIHEDLVSENLAKIFLNQGKTEKAIDIYKKLIWKFPQKRTYFASRIEEIQKN